MLTTENARISVKNIMGKFTVKDDQDIRLEYLTFLQGLNDDWHSRSYIKVKFRVSKLR